jgi:hypothetical protein
MRGNKVQLTFTITPELGRWLDEAATQEGLSRSALLTVIVNEWRRRRTT